MQDITHTTSESVFNTNRSVAVAGFTLSVPGVVALCGYALLFLIILLPIDMYSYDNKNSVYKKDKYHFGGRLILAILLAFPFLLSVYSVNCMVVGGCDIWSWIVAILTLLWSVIFTVSAFMMGSFRLNDMPI